MLSLLSILEYLIELSSSLALSELSTSFRESLSKVTEKYCKIETILRYLKSEDFGRRILDFSISDMSTSADLGGVSEETPDEPQQHPVHQRWTAI